ANKAAAELKRKSDLKKLLSAGRAAMNGKDLTAAAKAFADAAKLAPDDAEVARAQADLAQAQKLAKSELDAQAALKEKAAKVRDLVTNARAALKLKDLTTAAKVLSQAKELAPTDPGVVQALADLEQARVAAQGDAQKLANFQKAMDAGNAALAAKKY